MKTIWLTDSKSAFESLVPNLAAWGFEAVYSAAESDILSPLSASQEPTIIVIDGSHPAALSVCSALRPFKTRLPLFVLYLCRKKNLEDAPAALKAGADSFTPSPCQELPLQTALATARRLLEYQYTLENLTTELLQANRQLRDLTTRDTLTTVANRRYFDDYLAEEWKRAARREYPISVLLVELDLFNDYQLNYGAEARDRCLTAIAQFIDGTVSRAGDLVARYSQRQFAILLPNTDALGALVVAESVRVGIRKLAIPHSASPQQFVTVTLGTATSQPTTHNQSPQLLTQAEQALKQASAAGRNLVRQA